MINIYLSALETAEEKAKFEDLYIKYKQRMYAIAYKILHNVEDSENAVHNAFLKIADNFEEIKNFPVRKQKDILLLLLETLLSIFTGRTKMILSILLNLMIISQ